MATYDSLLKSALAQNQYKNPDITKRDVASVFTSFSDLRPKIEGFVFNDGTLKELLALDGTIPVKYRGSVYNIPVCIWLMDTHPYNPPLVYVKPTVTMQIKVGRDVDSDGKVDLTYLREWRYPNSDLLSLLQVMCITFGEDPPLFNKVSTTAPASDQTHVKTAMSSQTASGPYGGYPYPASGGYSSASTKQSPYPPYPASGGYSSTSTKPSPSPPATRFPYPGSTGMSGYPGVTAGTSPYPGVRTCVTSTTDTTAGGVTALTVAALKDLKYGDPDMAYQEVVNLLCVFPTLKPEVTTLVLPPRQLKKVVQIIGNIPVLCGGIVSAIPVSLTLMPDFPECAPMVYVTADDVTTESGSVVDDNGLVDIPYIKDWLYPRSNLVGLTHTLCVAFGENSPISSFTGASQMDKRRD